MGLQSTIGVGEVCIGGDSPPLFLADIGTYFNQDLACGKRLIDDIADCGLRFVKGEVLHDAGICLDCGLEEVITDASAHVTTERYRDVIERKVLPLSSYDELFSHARRRGLGLALSVYDETGLAYVLERGVEIIKVASSNIVHKPLIERIARAGRPAIIDTGRASLGEILRAVHWFVNAGGSALIVEYSPPAPPVPASMQNLRFIETLREVCQCPIGLSDHHAGEEMLYAAVALGAAVLEKGVCPDDLDREQDRAHALTVRELRDVVRKCGNVYMGMGNTVPELRTPQPPHPARMGLIAKRELRRGEVLTEREIGFAFPAVGVAVEDIERVLGWRVRKGVPSGAPIRWIDLDPA
jgi:sialic acid synthase SpsE